jgi:hypothetical protein
MAVVATKIPLNSGQDRMRWNERGGVLNAFRGIRQTNDAEGVEYGAKE